MSEILSILSSVGFNWHVALANFVNFLIILFIVNKFFFGKIGKTIEKRQEIIERGLNQASDAEKLLAHAETRMAEILATAEKEGKTIVSDAHLKGVALVSTLEHDAQEKIDTRLQAIAEKEASVEKRIEDSFAKRAPELVVELYKKTLLQEMNEEENDAFINRIRI
jgi:F-type H+-transporting ATPase subunit b